MRSNRFLGLCFLLTAGHLAAQSQAPTPDQLTLWYRQPATAWNQALPQRWTRIATAAARRCRP